MVNIDIDELYNEKDLLIRSRRVKINGNTIITPTRTIGVTVYKQSYKKDELQEAKRFANKKFKPFGEVFTKLTLSELNDIITDDAKSQSFSLKLANMISQLKEANALPYILLSITDENGNPLNHLLPLKAQKYISDLLWGIPGNSIIVTPLLGVLSTPDEYSKMIEPLYQRQKDAIDRKSQPLMAIVPPSYNLIDPKLIEKYWNCGIRIFGFNCENKKYGAYAPVIESIDYQLSLLSKSSEEKYLLHGINAKYKYGKSKTSRINNLIGAGYGFDTYAPNHIILKMGPQKEPPKRYIFNDIDYGFINILELENYKNIDKIINTNALRKFKLSELNKLSDSQKKKICDAHDIEKTIKEIQIYPSLIQKGELIEYLSSKEKINNEKLEIESLHNKSTSTKNNNIANESADKEWFK
jgi:hypothetical protein